MNFITEEEIQGTSIESTPHKFIGLEHYEKFREGVKFAEGKVDDLILLVIEFTLDPINEYKSADNIKDNFIFYIEKIKNKNDNLNDKAE